MDFGQLLETTDATGRGFRVNPPDDWRQGRTLYGGLALARAAEAAPPPAVAPPEACPTLFETAAHPAFSHHFALRRAGSNRLLSGATEGDLLVWVRHAVDVPGSTAALLLLADGLPPASYVRLTAPAAISTVTWSFELFAPERHRGAGWHLLRATADGVGDGYAGQWMAMWDADGRPVLRGRQSVALFA